MCAWLCFYFFHCLSLDHTSEIRTSTSVKLAFQMCYLLRAHLPFFFEDQLSQANEQRNIFLLNYRNICRKMIKPFNLNIQVN